MYRPPHISKRVTKRLFAHLQHHHGLTRTQIAERLDLSREETEAIRRYHYRLVEVEDWIGKVYDAFPNLNLHWLFLGLGQPEISSPEGLFYDLRASMQRSRGMYLVVGIISVLAMACFVQAYRVGQPGLPSARPSATPPPWLLPDSTGGPPYLPHFPRYPSSTMGPPPP